MENWNPPSQSTKIIQDPKVWPSPHNSTRDWLDSWTRHEARLAILRCILSKLGFFFGYVFRTWSLQFFSSEILRKTYTSSPFAHRPLIQSQSATWTWNTWNGSAVDSFEKMVCIWHGTWSRPGSTVPWASASQQGHSEPRQVSASASTYFPKLGCKAAEVCPRFMDTSWYFHQSCITWRLRGRLTGDASPKRLIQQSKVQFDPICLFLVVQLALPS
jgi:hypothetical protein